MRKEGLYKDTDSDIQLQYSYHHGSHVPLVVKSVILALMACLASIYTSTHARIILAAAFFTINHFISINKSECIFLPFINPLPNSSTAKTVSISQGIGLEVTLANGLILPQRSHRFIPLAKVVDVVILEGFRGLGVIYYLACMVEDHDKLVLILPVRIKLLKHLGKKTQ